jgi:hypothetical protein
MASGKGLRGTSGSSMNNGDSGSQVPPAQHGSMFILHMLH